MDANPRRSFRSPGRRPFESFIIELSLLVVPTSSPTHRLTGGFDDVRMPVRFGWRILNRRGLGFIRGSLGRFVRLLRRTRTLVVV
jgi:hypothetical protein